MPDLSQRGPRGPATLPASPFAKARRRLQATVLGISLAFGAAAVNAAPLPSHVYVVSNGWHTEIGLSASFFTGPLAAIPRAFPGARYLVFGWGERAFYMSPAPTWTEALRALLPARAVLLVLALGTAPPRAFTAGIHVVVLPLRPSGGKDLAAFLWQSFAKPPSGSLERIAGGPYPASAFYAATGTYDGGYTCNTWTADALRHAGLSVTTAGVVFAGQVMRQARRLCAECASPKASP